jgi:hypothetical protein
MLRIVSTKFLTEKFKIHLRVRFLCAFFSAFLLNHLPGVALVKQVGDRTLRIMGNDTQHIDTQHNDTQHNDTQHNDTQHNDTKHKLSLYRFTDCHLHFA